MNLVTMAGAWSTCHVAVQNGHVQVLEMLLEAGADVELKNNNGHTALDLAIYHAVKASTANTSLSS